jgi:hypothetical protein
MRMRAILRDCSFSPETTLMLDKAFDEAWQRLELTGGSLPSSDGQKEIARELLALRIIALARAGVHDSNHIIARAVAFVINHFHPPAVPQRANGFLRNTTWCKQF